MIIPHHLLSPEALRGVIEAFVTREGTDYGVQDVPLATKVLQVQQHLDAGTAVSSTTKTPRVARFSPCISDRTMADKRLIFFRAPLHVSAVRQRLNMTVRVA